MRKILIIALCLMVIEPSIGLLPQFELIELRMAALLQIIVFALAVILGFILVKEEDL